MRLVASSFRPGASARRVERAGAADTTCSKLSSTSRSCLSRRYSTSVSSALSPGWSRSPSACAITGTTSSGSRTGASWTKAAPLANRSLRPPASCRASRVLPVPPGPSSVRSRTSSRVSSAPVSASSRSRPTKAFGTCREAREPVVERVQRRELVRQAVDLELVELLRARQSFSTCSPRSRSSTLGSEQRARGLRDEHLAAVAGRHHARRVVHVEADVVPSTLRAARPCAGPCARGSRCRRASRSRPARAGHRRRAAAASTADPNATKNPSPSVPSTWPPWLSKASRRSVRWRSSSPGRRRPSGAGAGSSLRCR